MKDLNIEPDLINHSQAAIPAQESDSTKSDFVLVLPNNKKRRFHDTLGEPLGDPLRVDMDLLDIEDELDVQVNRHKYQQLSILFTQIMFDRRTQILRSIEQSALTESTDKNVYINKFIETGDVFCDKDYSDVLQTLGVYDNTLTEETLQKCMEIAEYECGEHIKIIDHLFTRLDLMATKTAKLMIMCINVLKTQIEHELVNAKSAVAELHSTSPHLHSPYHGVPRY